MIVLPAGTRLVLASASPRRADLLRSAGLEFDVIPADIDESQHPGELPSRYVSRLSAQKAAAVAERVGPGTVVLAADTTVDVDGVILEKPLDETDARRMLVLLSGRTHLVHTGVTVTAPAVGARTLVVETSVEFVPMTPATVDWYVATGEPLGKAGAYAIQGAGGGLVSSLSGSVTNVIGLPLAETLDLLRRTLDDRTAP